jgi:MFS superfamily sulfate permease-like transporter
VLAADSIDDVDFTGGKTVVELADQLKGRGVVFAVADATPELRRELDRFGVTDRIGTDHYFDTLEAARNAFRAQSPALPG